MNSDHQKLWRFRIKALILIVIGVHFLGWIGAIGGFLIASYFLQPRYSPLPPIR